MPTWELQLALAVDCRCAVTVVVPLPAGEAFDKTSHAISEQFAIDPERHNLVPLSHADGALYEKEQLMQSRDRDIVDRAGLLLPMSLRPGSSLEMIMIERAAAGAIVDERFRAEFRRRQSAVGYTITAGEYNTECDHIGPDYLIHWTRTCNSAWPDEKLIDYYRAVAASSHYPRSALETLSHMLMTKCIMASSRHMATGVRSVAFTGLTVREALPLMRWRARYRMMSLEPYGIGIRKEPATKMGVKPVIYCDSGELPVGGPERWLYQSRGERGDWPAEQEWRIPGDFGLDLPPGDVVAFCRFPGEAKIIAERHGVPTFPVTTGLP